MIRVWWIILVHKRDRRVKWLKITGSIPLNLQGVCLNLLKNSWQGLYWEQGVTYSIGCCFQMGCRNIIVLNGSQLQLYSPPLPHMIYFLVFNPSYCIPKFYLELISVVHPKVLKLSYISGDLKLTKSARTTA